jgi:uncharacterized membrane protein
MLHPEAPLALRLVLLIHIAAGSVALFVAPLALAVRKGGRAHRRWGNAYVLAMAVVAATAFVCGPYFHDYFLLLIAVFSSYLAFTGWRALAYKRPRAVAIVDWTGAALAVTAGLGMLAMSVVGRANFGSFSFVVAVFGTICMGAGIRSAYRFVRPPRAKAAWFIEHFSNMLAAYIATVTAFSVVNLTFLPVTVRWLWPTVVGTIAITAYNFKYRPLIARAGGRIETIVPAVAAASVRPA